MDHTNQEYSFGINFSTVPPIPDNPTELTKYHAGFKDLIKVERDKIKQFHRSGAGGREVVQAHTSLIDEVLYYLIESLTHKGKSSPEIILGEVPALPVADSFSVTVTANDPEGIYVIEYRLDAGGWIAVSGGSFNIDVPMLSDGVHDLEVQAIDNEGFKTVEPLISFECDGHKPEITLGEIPETATAMVQIDFTINDYSALSELHYRIAGGDEQPLNTEGTSLEWDSTTV